MSITDPELIEYADLLAENGFTIYVPKGTSFDYFTYSQVVDGKECFGNVQHETLRAFGGYSHSMPIRPSREHGSSMFVAGVEDALTLEAAQKVAQPSNYNDLVGTQSNFRDEYWLNRMYTKQERKSA
jgi:hypothetical protein